jgi:hypothetical protein
MLRISLGRMLRVICRFNFFSHVVTSYLYSMVTLNHACYGYLWSKLLFSFIIPTVCSNSVLYLERGFVLDIFLTLPRHAHTYQLLFICLNGRKGDN